MGMGPDWPLSVDQITRHNDTVRYFMANQCIIMRLTDGPAFFNEKLRYRCVVVSDIKIIDQMVVIGFQLVFIQFFSKVILYQIIVSLEGRNDGRNFQLI